MRFGRLCYISDLECSFFLAKVIYVLVHFLLINSDLGYFHFFGWILPSRIVMIHLGKQTENLCSHKYLKRSHLILQDRKSQACHVDSLFEGSQFWNKYISSSASAWTALACVLLGETMCELIPVEPGWTLLAGLVGFISVTWSPQIGQVGLGF